ncbi:DUF397 domain-containing protein [Micromonospora sp. WMMA1363]|uniref:DUF397 domain-containing protein n=1 Tax=Micromonospora sp. WMMA1363 TaxID=3053985 RepID=UPI00338DC610
MTNNSQPRNYRKSTRSGGSGGNCVEWSHTAHGVYIRDSKNPDGPELVATQAEWADFLAAVAADLEHPWISHEPAGVHFTKDGHRLEFTAAEWTAFVAGVHAGECEREPATV